MCLNILQYGKSYSSEWQIPEMFLEVHLIFTKLFSNPTKIKNGVGNMAESTRGAQIMIILSYNLYSGDEND